MMAIQWQHVEAGKRLPQLEARDVRLLRPHALGALSLGEVLTLAGEADLAREAQLVELLLERAPGNEGPARPRTLAADLL
jgi:hypothetical protein